MSERQTATRRTGLLPPGYRMTELGPLPEEWRVVRLGEILYPVSKKERRLVIQDGKQYTLLSVGLYGKGVSVKSVVLGKDLKTKTWYQVKDGDFLLLKIWARKGAYGFAKRIANNAIVSGDYPILRLDHNQASLEFVELYLSQQHVWQKLNMGAKGATSRQRVHERDFIEILSVPLPPLPEQRAIAHVLRAVQEAREATERVIAALRDLKRALMRHLFTYGPVPVGAADQVALQDTPIGPIPAHWRVVRLGEVVTLRKGTVHPSDVPNARYVGLEHLISGDIHIKQFGRANTTRSTKTVFEKGDILYGKLRPYLDKAAVAEWPGVCSTDILVLQPMEKRASLFLVYLMHTPFVLNHAIATTTGVNHPRTSWKALSQALVPLPPLDEQREIARILQTVDRKIEAEEARKEALDDLFRSLLHHLMTAKIRLPQGFVQRFAEGSHAAGEPKPLPAAFHSAARV